MALKVLMHNWVEEKTWLDAEVRKVCPLEKKKQQQTVAIDPNFASSIVFVLTDDNSSKVNLTIHQPIEMDNRNPIVFFPFLLLLLFCCWTSCSKTTLFLKWQDIDTHTD